MDRSSAAPPLLAVLLAGLPAIGTGINTGVVWSGVLGSTLLLIPSVAVAQLGTGIHWAEEPPSRICHMVSNVQILHASPAGAGPPSEVAVRCRFLVYRNRVETETDLLIGKREDTLRRVDGTWKIARRMVTLDQSVLLAKNLTFFI